MPFRPAGTLPQLAEPCLRTEASVVRTQRCGATTSISGPEQNLPSGAILASRGKTTSSAISPPYAKKKFPPL